jgi:hypothetical protein
MLWRRIIYKRCLVESALGTGEELEGEEHDYGRRSTGQYRLFEPQLIADPVESPKTRALAIQMGEALRQLSDDEREFIERHYYAGQTYELIGHEMKKSRRKLETTHRRAIRQLRKLLRPFAEQYFALGHAPVPGCPICQSPRREAIEQLIAARDPRQPWGNLMGAIKEQFGLEITSSMVFTGHMKFH